MNDRFYPVLVVGAGPAGLATSLGTIPIGFHIMLATFLYVFGRYHAP